VATILSKPHGLLLPLPRRPAGGAQAAIAMDPDSGKEAHEEGLGGWKEALCSSSHSLYLVLWWVL